MAENGLPVQSIRELCEDNQAEVEELDVEVLMGAGGGDEFWLMSWVK